MDSLWFYRAMSRVRGLGYRAKFMAMAFLGTHIPLIALAVHYGLRTSATWTDAAWSLGVTLAATLGGTVVTLLVLDHLLRPVLATSAALRRYRDAREVPALPRGFADEVGTLMADAQTTIETLEDSIRALGRTDQGTGLPNRDGFLAASDGADSVAVVRLADWDRLTQAFDGSVAQDILRTLAGRIAERLGPSVRIGRVGDQDLALALPHGEDTDLVTRLVADVSGKMDVRGQPTNPVVLAATAPVGEGGRAAALDDAIAALADTTESSPVTSHSPEARDRLRDRFRLEQELRTALERDEFVLHFQPVMDLNQHRFVGAEALVRWRSPSRGMVPPGSFIPVAEESGLIDALGLWVLRDACRQARTWGGAHRVAVNLAARQFMDGDLHRHVAEALDATGLPPDLLEIELTESVATADHDHTRRAFGRLRDMGVRIAIDDFGTGYASMSALRKLPFDKLKIDREFVSGVHANPVSQTICEAMVTLGHGLGLQVLAEGTEEAPEIAWLAARGCGLFQGFYFSRPLPGPDVACALDGSTATALAG